MSRGRIGVVSSDLAGGTGRNVLNLAGEWLAAGYAVDLLLQDFSGLYVPQLPPEVRQIPLPTTHALWGAFPIGRYLLSQRPDVLLTATPRLTVAALRARAATLGSTTVFANIHNTYSQAFTELSPKKARKRLRVLQRHYPRCDGIIPVSHGVARDFQAFTGVTAPPFHVIHNPIAPAYLQAQAAEPLGPGEIPGDPGDPLLVSVGRLVPQKNLPLLLEAFSRLRQSRRARLAIVGTGRGRSELEQAVATSPYAGHIHLLGYRANPFNVMAASSGLVLSSEWEGFGNVLAEAMALGVPVVSTDCPNGPREVLEDGRWGPLVPAGDAEALAEGMAQILDHPLSPGTLKAAVAHLDARHVAHQYLVAFGLEADSRAPTGDEEEGEGVRSAV